MKSVIMTEIISIGDELLAGLTVNSNAAFIAERLGETGLPVCWITTIGDDAVELDHALTSALRRARIIIMTGGLGPTHDDITTRVAAEYFHSRIIFDESVLADVEVRLRSRGREATGVNRDQAMVPEKAEILRNEIGTAPGFLFRKEDRLVFILPGVPAEMKRMFEKSVLPRIEALGSEPYTKSIILRTVNIPESSLYERVESFIDDFPDVRLAFLPQPSGVNMRLTAVGDSENACAERLAEAENVVREKAGEVIYGSGNTRLEEVVAGILADQGLTISVAESCTGGLISSKLTNIPGSSTFFNRGIIAYSNEAKENHLGVPGKTIETHGAVSSETAVAMAEGIRRVSGTDIGLSTTGIAGPGGGSDQKPVGTVYIGYADAGATQYEHHRFYRDRLWNKERFAVAALDLVRRRLIL